MSRPKLGVINGGLSECPDKPNCLCSCSAKKANRVLPYPLNCSADEACDRLIAIVSSMKRSRIVEQVSVASKANEVGEDAGSSDRYIRVEFRSFLFRFVDDFELLISETDQVIHVRSASRVGYGDLGVNARRVEFIRQALAELDNTHE
jgi:uncharacterized protein (DUF1499 family)